MTKLFEGRKVTLIRDAKAGDAGFDAKKDQVLINDAGAQKVVDRSAVTDEAK